MTSSESQPRTPDWRENADDVIGYALLETEHIPGFARRGPSFREKLAEAGWKIVREAEAAQDSRPLDVAWANAALAADGRGWRLLVLQEHEGSGGGWTAIAGPGGRGAGVSGQGRTPDAALSDLVARLAAEEPHD